MDDLRFYVLFNSISVKSEQWNGDNKWLHTMESERRRSRVVRTARLWFRKSPKVVNSRLGFTIRRLENPLCQPSSKWVPISIQGRIMQRKERYVLLLSSAVPKIQWESNPTDPTAIGLREICTFSVYSW